MNRAAARSYPFQVIRKFMFNRPGEVFYIGGNDILPAPLSAEREAEVIEMLGTEKEKEGKSVLIEHNLRLVVYIAKKFDNTGVGVEDLISIGTIGLIKAINTFDPIKNIKLATYASRCIENEILMYLRRNSKTKLEVSQAENKAANERSEAAKHALASNQAKTESMNANIQRLEAEVEQAKLNLKYTKIYAPQSGKVSARSVEKGNYLQVGQPLMQIVPKEVWVVANFKEIQLTNMKEHQPVSIKIDTYPGKRFKGEVQSIQRATGAKSSLFPPENAVGSYVKIVQRVPVKIIFKEDISDYNIVPGMSVVPKVKVK